MNVIERKFNFGKYNGKHVVYVIITHIGYVMWCLENIKWFKLTEDEQKLYDAIAIAIKKYGMNTTFPIDILLNHVSNRESLNTLDTPFILKNGIISFSIKDINNPLCKMVFKHATDYFINKKQNSSLLNMDGLQHCFNKDICNAYYDGNYFDYMTPLESEIFDF